MIYVNDFSPVLLELGPLDVRWYGVLFAVGVILNYLIARWAFKREGYKIEDLDSVAVYLFLGMIIGARLGHVFFYNAEYFSQNPVEIPMLWKGGLASHGAVIGLFAAYFLWCRIHKVKFAKYPDVLVLGFPLVAMFVRIGNFFNSEIVGVPTKGNFGVVFARLGEDFARHPAQLYEAFLSLAAFVILIIFYKKFYRKTPRLFFLFLLMLLYFTGRFFIEFVKARHIIPQNIPLSMGQFLSIIPIAACIIYFVFFFRKQKKV